MNNPIAHIQIETNQGTFKFEIYPTNGSYEIRQVLPTKLDIALTESFDQALTEITNYFFYNEIEIIN